MPSQAFLRGATNAIATVGEVHRRLQTDSSGNALVENEPTRVGDIGVGTLVFLIINIMYIGICCLGSMMARPGCMYFWGTTFYVTIMVFLFEATRTPRWVSEEEVLDDSDEYFNSRLFLLIFFSCFSGWNCCFYIALHLTPSVVGRVPEEAEQGSAFIKARAFF
ncbi:hypothetical protein TeGR_g6764 [Tetraparma gracilis]|uniref:Uncharacterized protein n=1 Tax=Tetraparma gracilis TaxID=2962635 RepID=A0ABQ6NBI8_9STRA|nr:hypothetical protein TeGR_g6764 [Tetraparma gracilis]